MHSVLVTPIGLGVQGNGLSQRCAMWADALASMGRVTRVVVPVVGPVDDDPDVIVIEPSPDRSPLVPTLARGVTRDLGLSAGAHIHLTHGPVDVVVGVRSYLGDLCLGIRGATGARLVVDLDDDDVSFFAAAGEHDEARLFQVLIDRLAAEADALASAQGFAGTVTVPNGVKVPESVPFERTRGARPRVLFLGNMGYRPNRDAAEWIIDGIAPAIRARRPDVIVDIAGPGSEDLSEPGIGFVDDLDELMKGVDVFIAPLREGSGTRIKILDAWARAVPTVSTSVGAHGLGGVDGEHLVLADDTESIAEAVIGIIGDPGLAARLGAASRDLVLERYSREHVVGIARSVIQEVTGEPAREGTSPFVVTRYVEALHLVEEDGGLIALDTVSGCVHELDANASVVFALIDGSSTDDEIVREVQSIYGLDTPPIEAVTSALADLVEIGLAVRVRLDGDGFHE